MWELPRTVSCVIRVGALPAVIYLCRVWMTADTA